MAQKETAVPACALPTEANAERFARECRRAISHDREANGIGTLSEKTLHAVTKAFLCGEGDVAEVPVGRFVADILRADGGIFEVQTKGFYRLLAKLDEFLPAHPVTVVYPYPFVKYVVTIDAETGETSPRRRSPRSGKLPFVFDELYALRPMLGREGLSVRVLLTEVTEYRTSGKLEGKSAAAKRQRRGSTCFERMPSVLLGDVRLDAPADYAALLPELPEIFSVADLAATERVHRNYAWRMLAVLETVGALERAGKSGNAVLYRKLF